MTIDPVNNLQSVLQPQLNKAAKNDAQPVPQEEALAKTTDVLKQQDMVAQLKTMDEIRPEVVALGKALAKDSSFPSGKELDQLAQALLSPIVAAE